VDDRHGAAGSHLADELRMLFDAVADRAGPWLDRAAADGPTGTCTWCPLCAAVAVLRGEPSDLATRGLEQTADLVALVRAVLADRWDPGTPHPPGFTPHEHTGSNPTKVQRIPVRRKETGDPP